MLLYMNDLYESATPLFINYILDGVLKQDVLKIFQQGLVRLGTPLF